MEESPPERDLKYATSIAIVGSAWMALVVILRRFPEIWKWFLGLWGVVEILPITEHLFSIFLLIFFVTLFGYCNKRQIRPKLKYTTLTAMIGSSWMVLVSVLHRFPVIWKSFVGLQAGRIFAVTELLYVLCFLVFFISFYKEHHKRELGVKLQSVALIAIIAIAWMAFVSILHLFPVIWEWFRDLGVGRILQITEPVVAISFLLFFSAYLPSIKLTMSEDNQIP